jgi:hypothetical protein
MVLADRRFYSPNVRRVARLRSLDVLVILGLIIAWSIAGRHGYHGGWLTVAIFVTVVLLPGTARRLFGSSAAKPAAGATAGPEPRSDDIPDSMSSSPLWRRPIA